MKVGILADELSSLNLKNDSTIFLIKEAVKRGFKCYYFTEKSLSISQGSITVEAFSIKIAEDNSYEAGLSFKLNLSSLDILLFRKEPPFNIDYITISHILELAKSYGIKVVNDPFWVRNSPEKIAIFEFGEFIPETAILSDINLLEEFVTKHKEVILKPLYEFGGRGIVKIGQKEGGLGNIFTDMQKKHGKFLVAQRYLPEIYTKGDVRVILIDGEIAGAIARYPQEGKIIANIAAGGIVSIVKLSHRQIEICNKMKEALPKKGLFFVGIDLIGDYLTEINVTCPTGIAPINSLYNIKLEELFWNKLLAI